MMSLDEGAHAHKGRLIMMATHPKHQLILKSSVFRSDTFQSLTFLTKSWHYKLGIGLKEVVV